MNHLLSGVALAAVLAITAPVWAQAPTSPSTPNTPPSAASSTTTSTSTTTPSAQAPAAPQRPIAATPAAPSAQAPMAAQKATPAPAAKASAMEPAKPRRHAQRIHATPRHQMHAHNVRHWHRTHYGWGTSSDHMARQLNAQELGRIGGYGGGNPPHDSPN
jgi:hypothetical protein